MGPERIGHARRHGFALDRGADSRVPVRPRYGYLDDLRSRPMSTHWGTSWRSGEGGVMDHEGQSGHPKNILSKLIDYRVRWGGEGGGGSSLSVSAILWLSS